MSIDSEIDKEESQIQFCKANLKMLNMFVKKNLPLLYTEKNINLFKIETKIKYKKLQKEYTKNIYTKSLARIKESNKTKTSFYIKNQVKRANDLWNIF